MVRCIWKWWVVCPHHVPRLPGTQLLEFTVFFSYCKTKRSCKGENFGDDSWVVVFEVDWGWIGPITISVTCLNRSVPLCSMIGVVFNCSLTPTKKNSSSCFCHDRFKVETKKENALRLRITWFYIVCVFFKPRTE